MTPALFDEVSARVWLAERFDAAAIARLEHLVALLRAENQHQNLVSRVSLDQVWQRHIADSAQLLGASRATGAWLDLGTGAGFPGLVIAALQTDRPVVLVDSRRLRCEWLERAAAALALPWVRIIHSRVEDMPDQTYAVISARAFAPLDRLLTLASRFSTPQTVWLLPKGAKARHELSALGESWRTVFHVEQSLTDSAAGVLIGHVLGGPIDNSKGAHR